jgi:hypothetical protein
MPGGVFGRAFGREFEREAHQGHPAIIADGYDSNEGRS